MTKPPHNGRRAYTCPQCGRLLANVRPEMIVLRRLILTDMCKHSDREGDEITLICRCGGTVRLRWAMLQR